MSVSSSPISSTRKTQRYSRPIGSQNVNEELKKLEEVLKEGYLEVRLNTTGALQSHSDDFIRFMPRHFVLTKSSLSIYKNQQEKIPEQVLYDVGIFQHFRNEDRMTNFPLDHRFY